MKDYGLDYKAGAPVSDVTFLVDETWVDEAGLRQVDRAIFDALYQLIDEAESFVLLDLFLVNQFGYEPGPDMRPLTMELTERLVAKRKKDPHVKIIFISDPLNTLYGALESPFFATLESAGVEVVWTDLNRLRDSNPIYSKPWRLFAQPWGTGPGGAMKNPLGEGRISVRSFLKLLNFKANHRKVVLTERALMVMTANPHSASSAHWNMALLVRGALLSEVWQAEQAVLRLSGRADLAGQPMLHEEEHLRAPMWGNVLTERQIKREVVGLLNRAGAGDEVRLVMFYFSEDELIKAMIGARRRGAMVRVILDPNKDAFGRTKSGIPNRQTAARLVDGGIEVRWAATHGEQCHAKTLLVDYADGASVLVLGSGNYTRRNMNNYNLELDLALHAPMHAGPMGDLRALFERWWGNDGGRLYTADYAVYEDRSLWRRFVAWLSEASGLGTF